VILAKLNLITGSTGLLGSHIAEQLVARNEPVRALVRPTSDTIWLRERNVELVAGDLHDAAALRRAVEGVDVVYHCGAYVGDWGSWKTFFDGTVLTARNVVEACRSAGKPRLLHVSSISVYGKTPADAGELGEDYPVGQGHWLWDYYGRSKVLAEEEVRQYSDYTMVRPSWIYGPRDRVSMQRLVDALRSGTVRMIGSGENRLNMIYAADVAAGAILAANEPSASQQAYHLCSYGEITQRELLSKVCEILELPPVKRRVPMRVAWSVAFTAELTFRLLRRERPPPFTRRGVYLMGRPTSFSIRKAQDQLGWKPQVGVDQGLAAALDWYLKRK
jgi:nucleoside-diphosphate-sugar epimerase